MSEGSKLHLGPSKVAGGMIETTGPSHQRSTEAAAAGPGPVEPLPGRWMSNRLQLLSSTGLPCIDTMVHREAPAGWQAAGCVVDDQADEYRVQ
jgi:hypothetical protein